LVWCGPAFDPTGYADEVRGMVAALEAARQPVCLRTNPVESLGFRDTLASDHRALLERSLARPIEGPFLQLQHSTIDSFNSPHDSAVYSIGRSMFETDSLPSHWVSGANAVDELWVPGEFNRQTFRDAGVRTPLHVIPGGIDSDQFRPGVEPYAVPGALGTVFLSVFEWRLRKGWDVLLRAWADAFTPDDDVTLVLRTYPISQSDARSNTEVINERVNAFLHDQCGGRSRTDVARIVVLGQRVAARDLPALYGMSHAFVLPTRGEGWGRPFMESMACGVPVIATNWSAHLAFMNDENSYLVDTDGLVLADSVEVPLYAKQRWANPSLTHLVTQLRRVHADRAEARAMGVRARADMVNEWPWSRAADAIAARLLDINGTLNRLFAGGGDSRTSSEAIVVRGGDLNPAAATSNAISWMQALYSHDDANAATLSWRPRRRDARPAYGSSHFPLWRRMNTPIAGIAVQISVLDDAAHTSVPTPPATGHWIIDVDSIVADGVPPHLVTVLRDQADMVVVPHASARDACIDVGVDAARLAVLSPAIDTDRFTTSGAAYRRESTGETRFLLLGRDLPHRALQHVLSAYDRTFSALDDVVLHIVLPNATSDDTSSWQRRFISDITKQKRHPRSPRLWVDAMPILVDEMPALYRSCDVMIHAGSGTGRGQTIREAMACGVPVIATAIAPATELLDESCGWLVTPGSSGSASNNDLQLALREATDRTVRQQRSVSARRRALGWPTRPDYHNKLRDLIESCRGCNSRQAFGESALLQAVAYAFDDVRTVVLLAHADWHSGAAPAIVRAYATTCTSSDDVTLALCLDPAQRVSIEDAQTMVREAMCAAGRSEDEGPDIILLPDWLDAQTLRRMYASADIVVTLRDAATAATARQADCDVLASLDPSRWQAAIARAKSRRTSHAIHAAHAMTDTSAFHAH